MSMPKWKLRPRGSFRLPRTECGSANGRTGHGYETACALHRAAAAECSGAAEAIPTAASAMSSVARTTHPFCRDGHGRGQTPAMARRDDYQGTSAEWMIERNISDPTEFSEALAFLYLEQRASTWAVVSLAPFTWHGMVRSST